MSGPARTGFGAVAAPFLAVALLVNTSASVHAAAISISDPFLQYINIGPNPLGFTSGEQIRIGATTVTPNGTTGGTTATATTTNLASGALISRPVGAVSSLATPDFFTTAFAICTVGCLPFANNNVANLQGPWSLNFSNATTTPTTASATLSLAAGFGEIPFLTNITLGGTAAAPVFKWIPPPGLTINGYRVNIYQNDLEKFNQAGQIVNNGLIASVNLQPTVTQYTVQASDLAPGASLSPNTNYTIEIGITQTRDGSSTILANRNVASISRVYSTFQIPSATSPTVNLPTVSGNVFSFNFLVTAGLTYSIDPLFAAGYIYKTGAGDPNIRTVSLPNIGNPSPYHIYLWNGTSFVFDVDLAAGAIFDFGALGVDMFEVLGIDPALGLDPSNPLAFITNLTFVSSGAFTGTMTPVTVEAAAVPEPASVILLASGLAGLGFGARRSRNIHRTDR